MINKFDQIEAALLRLAAQHKADGAFIDDDGRFSDGDSDFTDLAGRDEVATILDTAHEWSVWTAHGRVLVQFFTPEKSLSVERAGKRIDVRVLADSLGEALAWLAKAAELLDPTRDADTLRPATVVARDPDAPCEEFRAGPRDRQEPMSCVGDGHYLCRDECARFEPQEF